MIGVRLRRAASGPSAFVMDALASLDDRAILKTGSPIPDVWLDLTLREAMDHLITVQETMLNQLVLSREERMLR